MSSDYSVLCIGCGHMAGAMVRGWRDNSLAITVTVVDPRPLDVELQVDHHASSLAGLDREGVFDVVLLAVPPQIAETAIKGLADYLQPETLVISIMAGKTLDYLASLLFGHRALVRVMPNMPAQIGQGICGYIAAQPLNAVQQSRFDALIGVSSKTVALQSEADIDSVTALSGSGPAYVFLLIKAMTEAGINLGLKPEQAQTLAAHTVAGGGQFALHSPKSAPELLDTIAITGGTTEAALQVLNAENAFGALLDQAISAAHRRAQEL